MVPRRFQWHGPAGAGSEQGPPSPQPSPPRRGRQVRTLLDNSDGSRFLSALLMFTARRAKGNDGRPCEKATKFLPLLGGEGWGEGGLPAHHLQSTEIIPAAKEHKEHIDYNFAFSAFLRGKKT